MNESFLEFAGRLNKIEAKKSGLNRGYQAVVGDDGLIIFTTRKQKRSFPIRGLMLTISAMIVFKAAMLVSVGPETYAARVQSLAQGSAVERLGAGALAPDRVTVNLARIFKEILG